MNANKTKQSLESETFASTECRQCVELLRQVLSKPGSRPSALLEAIAGVGGISKADVQQQKNGVVIQYGLQEGPDCDKLKSTPFPEVEPTTAEEPTTTASLVRRWTQSRFRSTVPKPLAASAASTESSSKQQASKRTSLSIDCRPCGSKGPEGGARAFVMGPDPLSVVVCSNRLLNLGSMQDDDNEKTDALKEMEQILVHELIHIHDVTRLGLDLQQCMQLAYSEVRAAREGECHSSSSSWMMPQSWCVQHKAKIATSNLFPGEADGCVERVFVRAMADKRPFEKEKNSGAGGGSFVEAARQTATKASVSNNDNKTTATQNASSSTRSDSREPFFVPFPSDR